MNHNGNGLTKLPGGVTDLGGLLRKQDPRRERTKVGILSLEMLSVILGLNGHTVTMAGLEEGTMILGMAIRPAMDPDGKVNPAVVLSLHHPDFPKVLAGQDPPEVKLTLSYSKASAELPYDAAAEEELERRQRAEDELKEPE